jgi:DNA-3-methyladenine glycosylase
MSTLQPGLLHYCLNFSCLNQGDPGGVLIRALEPIAGLETMARLRGLSSPEKSKLLCSGPGRLCEALGTTGGDNGLDVMQPGSRLQTLDDGGDRALILVTSRIGISKAKDPPLRFVVTVK